MQFKKPTHILLLLTTLLAVTARAEPLTQERVGALLDDAVPAALERYHVPGAVVSVVQAGEVLFARGYGVADIESGTAIDPASTQFRVASISKLFAAMAVMQLVEEDKLSLDVDVNQYLDGAWLPDYQSQPVTLRQLLNHTAGFDDRFLGMAARSADGLEDLGGYLRRRMPPRVMPPGVAISYSNHGVALAGLVVEEVSGLSFTDYVQQRILDPLGMERSSFHLMPDQLGDMATGYDYKQGQHTPAPYDYPHTVPASPLVSTAEDMARFMIAHLQRDARLMRTKTYDEMHTAAFRHHPQMPGRALGFGEADYNGRRIIQHTGLIWGFSSLLMLMPEEDVGLFVSVTTDATGAYARIRSAFLNEFFPEQREPEVAPDPLAGSAERIGAATGSYLHNRRPRSTFLKFGSIAPQFVTEVQVAAGDAPGEILLRWPRSNGGTRRYSEMSPWYFREVSGDAEKGLMIRPGARALAFIVDAKDKPTHLAMGSAAYDRIPWYQSGNVLLGTLGAASAVCVVYLLLWPVAWWWRRKNADDPLRWARRFLTLSVVSLVVFLAGLGVVMSGLQPYAIGYGPPAPLPALLLLPLIALPCSFIAAALVVDARRRGIGSTPARVCYAGVTSATLVVLALLSYWNLLGYHYG